MTFKFVSLATHNMLQICSGGLEFKLEKTLHKA